MCATTFCKTTGYSRVVFIYMYRLYSGVTVRTRMRICYNSGYAPRADCMINSYNYYICKPFRKLGFNPATQYPYYLKIYRLTNEWILLFYYKTVNIIIL